MGHDGARIRIGDVVRVYYLAGLVVIDEPLDEPGQVVGYRLSHNGFDWVVDLQGQDGTHWTATSSMLDHVIAASPTDGSR